jgi:hypothetical protein
MATGSKKTKIYEAEQLSEYSLIKEARGVSQMERKWKGRSANASRKVYPE